MHLSIPNKDFSTRDYQFIFIAVFSLLPLLVGRPDLVIANIKA